MRIKALETMILRYILYNHNHIIIYTTAMQVFYSTQCIPNGLSRICLTQDKENGWKSRMVQGLALVQQQGQDIQKGKHLLTTIAEY